MSATNSQILLVEDEPDIPPVIQSCLRTDQVVITTRNNGLDGLEFLKSNGADLVLLDLGLPQMDGLEVLRQIKSDPRLFHIPVIIITGWSDVEDKVRGFDLGAADYVTKPFEIAELRARVRSALRAKHLRDRLTVANRELEAARAVAESTTRSKSEFLAQMSHEIRTPMNGVIAVAGLLNGTNLNREQQELVETIRSSGESLVTIINDILDFSKIESGRMELERHPFDLHKCVEESMDLLNAKAVEKRIEFNCQIDDDIPRQAVGDVTRFRQVLVNLLGNAIKFTRQGEVSLRLRLNASATPASATKHLPSEARTFQVHVAVRDTGIGIPPAKQSRLFQAFGQADASTARHYGGTGLGLVISKSLVELMGGRMWVESVEGEGSTFHFNAVLEEAPTPVAVSQPAPELAGMRILVVDDNATNRRILSLQARKWGVETHAVETPQEALDAIASPMNLDAVILDMQMPGMDGLSLAAEIRKRFPARNLPLVLLTSMGMDSAASKAALATFRACLYKPLKASHFLEVLTRLRKGGDTTPQRVERAPAQQRLDGNLGARCPLRLLLVDDNLVNQKVATRLFQQMGYASDVANNGLECLEMAAKKDYDVIFMDLQMPELDGLEATRRLRAVELEQSGGAPPSNPITIVAMTANAMQGDREKCLNAGMDDYVSKPVSPLALQSTLERWFGRRLARIQAAPVSFPKPPAAPTLEAPALESEPAQEPGPVNVDQLLSFTDGTQENLNELAELFVRQTSLQLDSLRMAIQAGASEEVRKVAHSCAGSTSTCGMTFLAELLVELEKLSDSSSLDGADQLLGRARLEFNRVRVSIDQLVNSGRAQSTIANN